MPGWQTNLHDAEQFKNFGAHFKAAKELLSVSFPAFISLFLSYCNPLTTFCSQKSKAAVLNLLKGEYYYASFGLAPIHALKVREESSNLPLLAVY